MGIRIKFYLSNFKFPPNPPKKKITLEIRKRSDAVYFSLLKRPYKRFKFSPRLGYIFLRAIYRYPPVSTQVLTVICNIQYSLWNSWRFPREITSEEREQKFHTDDVSLPRSGSVPHWSCREICVNQSMYGTFCAHFSDVISREKPVVVSRNEGCFLIFYFFIYYFILFYSSNS